MDLYKFSIEKIEDVVNPYGGTVQQFTVNCTLLFAEPVMNVKVKVNRIDSSMAVILNEYLVMLKGIREMKSTVRLSMVSDIKKFVKEFE
ncbi:hypothetical protein PTQ21_12255 [Paenibacillus marchantiae]|uniref:hypothetical protein n=1 Tax=Paenibacillus marchantiae TaxID=3026433 RepID=UPI00237B1BCD|nr:hypothetical protein [Paenibacillus marchantiae]WDQ34962.1 hypothetical protein PTQ21_12255 [Paenibacillus marchantiae]